MEINKLWFKAVLIFAVAITIVISYKNIQHPGNLIWSDAGKDTNYIRPYKDTQKIHSKYTCGVAMLEMPFFFDFARCSRIKR